MIPDTFGEVSSVYIVKGSSTSDCNSEYSCFEPTEHTVGLNDRVIWITLDVDGVKHHVTSKDGKFDSPALEQRNSQNACWPNCISKWSYIFAEYGTYDYYCKIHPWMKGTIIVTGKGLNAEVGISNEWGSAYIDKYEYEAAPDKTIYVKIYGDVTREGIGDRVTLFITHPNGKIETNYAAISSDREWEIPIKVGGNERGQFRVDVQHDPLSIGMIEFEVVDLISGIPKLPSQLQSGQDTITIDLDSTSYKKGDVVKVSGSVNISSDPLKAFAVTVKIQDPKNNLKVVNQLTPESDGSYSIPIQTGESWKEEGVYTVTASYDNYSATTSFAFSVPEGIPAPTFPPDDYPIGIQLTTELTLDPLDPRIQVGETVTFSGTLWYFDSVTGGKKPVGEGWKIWIRDGTNALIVGGKPFFITTQSNGVFLDKIRIDDVSEWQFFAYFDGGEIIGSDYESAISQTQYLTVERSPGAGPVTAPPEGDSPAGGVALLVIIVIVIIAAIAIKKRGKGGVSKYTKQSPKPKPRKTKTKTSVHEDYDINPNHCLKCRRGVMRYDVGWVGKRCNICGWEWNDIMGYPNT